MSTHVLTLVSVIHDTFRDRNIALMIAKDVAFLNAIHLHYVGEDDIDGPSTIAFHLEGRLGYPLVVHYDGFTTNEIYTSGEMKFEIISYTEIHAEWAKYKFEENYEICSEYCMMIPGRINRFYKSNF